MSNLTNNDLEWEETLNSFRSGEIWEPYTRPIVVNDPTVIARRQLEFDGNYIPGNRTTGDASNQSSWFSEETQVINPYRTATYIAGTDPYNQRPWYEYMTKTREQILEDKINDFKSFLRENYPNEKMIEDIIAKNFLSRESQLKIFKEKAKNFKV